METVNSTGSITTTITTSKDQKKCFAIERTLREAEGGKAILFGMFPTLGNNEEDKYTLDKTAKHLMDHMKDLGLRNIIVVNLFSKICRGFKMSSRNLMVDEENLEYIDHLFKMADIKDYKLIMAYGCSMGTSNALKETLKALFTLIEFYGLSDQVFQITTNGLSTANQRAVHLLYLGIRHPSAHWRLEPFKITKELLHGENKKETVKKANQSVSNVKNIRKKGD